ncbi:beta strand repeat-containing protein [Leadbettera azotonutricia]|uniref:Putative lipoprotein n=1 Tax=Leadbettera azotonutricia (strain ATCC BAA-888 / DSM 13862 / ZAS-9) TaxID=545695 RepID=F5YG74_LEAAZ|nr:lipoprotein [Leadbettera azotonutricia]AEF81506.1 putative lipoprotein [Leadbettera azotonutricia ZAS-9]
MKGTKKTMPALLALIIGLLIFGGCENLSLETKQVPTAGKGLVQVSLGSPGTRTLLPGAKGLYYRLVFTALDKTTVNVYININAATAEVELTEGIWDLEVKGYATSSSTPVLITGTKTGIQVIPGETLSVEVELGVPTVMGTAHGTLDYTISFPANVSTGTIAISAINGGAPLVINLLTQGIITESDGIKISSGNTSVLSGYYWIAVELTGPAGKVGQSEIAHIYQQLTTRAEYTFTEDDFSRLPEVKSIAVSPQTVSVGKGEDQQFGAVVTVTGDAVQTVTWGIVGSSVSGTTINGDGLLTIDAGETATTLTVKAISTHDTSKFATAEITVIVNAKVPEISGQPTGADYSVGAAATALSVTASVTDSGTLSYQWYSNATNSMIGGTPVGTDSASYIPSSTATAGTLYYYVIVTNTNNSVNGNTSVAAASNIAAVTVYAGCYVLEEDGIPGSIYEANTFTDILDWFGTPGNTTVNTGYTITLNADATIAPFTLNAANLVQGGVTITLRGEGRLREINLITTGSLFTIESGYTLALDNNITLKGRTDNTVSLVRVNNYGNLHMKHGARITGNTATATPSGAYSNSIIHGGGVYVADYGTFTMDGGEISDNAAVTTDNGGHSSLVSLGGGVYVANHGTFTMISGKISGNTASSNPEDTSDSHSTGGGIFVAVNGTFVMESGEISSNTASCSASFSSSTNDSYGGGVYADGAFTMKNGKIVGNTAATPSSNSYGGGVYVCLGTFTMKNGEIFDNTANSGGGAYVYTDGTFFMEDGKIVGNSNGVETSGTFTMKNGEISGNRFTGVYVDDHGTFTMKSGEISGNTHGVSVHYGAFAMEDGRISGNTHGGVYVSYGIFTMGDGEIFGNTADLGDSYGGGGGVNVTHGTFTMKNGEIFGNTVIITVPYYSGGGGGVCVYYGTFNMEGGKISGNTVNLLDTIGGGGGVYVFRSTFAMKGGEISGNTVTGVYSRGGGVYVDWEQTSFTKTGGIIYGYTANTASPDYSKNNMTKALDGAIRSSQGHAVISYYALNSTRRRETTVTPAQNLDSTLSGSAGGWIE